MCFPQARLLIVDEEQRFGVSHKERLKEISKQVDVLTLSARDTGNLNMAMSGIRDMSPSRSRPGPSARSDICTGATTGVSWPTPSAGSSPGRAVYYVHTVWKNRADGGPPAIDAGRRHGCCGHGQMDEETRSGVMERMAAGEVQVLVCTRSSRPASIPET
jgi:transcription-repair coupling factor (superfamily II helicase)